MTALSEGYRERLEAAVGPHLAADVDRDDQVDLAVRLLDEAAERRADEGRPVQP